MKNFVYDEMSREMVFDDVVCEEEGGGDTGGQREGVDNTRERMI